MTARLFIDSDKAELKEWMKARDMNVDASLESLPALGIIYPGVAAGFLRLCEGGYALMDGYITNPEASSEDRDTALDAITAALIVTADKRGIKNLIAITKHWTIASRAERHGFSPQPVWVVLTRP
jgi:hypothetical protein